MLAARVKRFGLMSLLVVLGAGLMLLPGLWHSVVQPTAQAASEAEPKSPAGVELISGRAHTLFVPREVRQSLGIERGGAEAIAIARKPTRGQPLVMPGSTMFDPGRIMRIRARFAPSPSSAEVVEIGQRVESSAESQGGRTTVREIRSGDRVKKGEILAVFHSVDVGNKKNDLVDALYQLHLDEQILRRAEQASSALPDTFLLTTRRNVQGDQNAVHRALNTLQTWGISDEDIRAVREEADNVKKRQGRHDQAREASWARVEIRAPDDGVIIERNVSLHEIIADNTTNLFQVARVDQLGVVANVPEEDLPALERLPTWQRVWTVRTVGSPAVQGMIDDIGYLIDPNQHTAVVKGHIQNPREVLRAGQFITATVELPPPADVVEVPVDAVVEDGQESIVFVETEPTKHYYTMRRVEVRERFENTVFVRSKPFDDSEQLSAEEKELGMLPKEPLRPGERVLQTAAGELKTVLLDKESEQRPEPDQGKTTK